MAYAEKRSGRDGRPYYRARYRRPDGAPDGTVLGSDGKAIKYPTKATAVKAAREAEAEADAAASRGRWVAPEKGRITLGEYILGKSEGEGWLARQDLAASTEQSYGHYLKRILPTFGETPLAGIEQRAIDAWEKGERARGSAVSSATYRRILHLVLEDAVAEGLLAINPAKRRRNRGKRAGKLNRGPEKVITTALGALLIAERASLLSKRDDEFVAMVSKPYTGMRWGEIIGLQPEFVRDEAFRIEQQLYELDGGRFVLCPPKDDSYRTADSPRWLTRLVKEHVAQIRPTPCSCHGMTFVFRGGRSRKQATATQAAVARQAGVAVGTVGNVLNHPERVTEKTRARVEKAMAEVGFVRDAAPAGAAAHWRRSGFSAWVWDPAVSGWYSKKGRYEAHPVAVTASPWPGVPVRGQNPTGAAKACWVPIRSAMTRHALRHLDRTIMEELG
ncbi:LacI family DNA-binding transcriptional regulator, partial [Nocardia asteroides]